MNARFVLTLKVDLHPINTSLIMFTVLGVLKRTLNDFFLFHKNVNSVSVNNNITFFMLSCFLGVEKKIFVHETLFRDKWNKALEITFISYLPSFLKEIVKRFSKKQ